MSTSTPEHAADEAGGEAIYSSDGLPTLPTPPPPIPQPKNDADAEEDNNAVIEYDGSINPTNAFEVFSGKVFTSSSTSPLSSKQEGETPLEKLARLQAEVSSLESDLTTHSIQSKEGDEALRTMAKELAVKLSTLNVRENMVQRQQNLTELVQLEMDKLSSPTSAAKTEEGGTEEDVKNKITYELYGNAASSTSSSSSNLEERLRKLELLLGSSSKESGSDDVTVLKRLEQAENLASRVDEASLEKAAGRAKVIRVDLEAAAKARLKLSAINSTKSDNKNDDTKTISTLYDQLQSLENITQYLPTVVSRLQDLASLHTTSATFATRLTQVENMAVQSEKMMKDVEEALGKMEKGLEENVKVVKENVKVLDERMNAL